MANSIRDYTPGVGSYKVEEGGSIRGIDSSGGVDHQLGTLSFSRDDISFDAMGPKIALSSKFNSDHMYSTIIQQVADGLQPTSLNTVPGDPTNYYRLANGWSWDLPFLTISLNVFKLAFRGRVFDLSSIITPQVCENNAFSTTPPTELWVEGYHVRLSNLLAGGNRTFRIAIPEDKIILTGTITRTGTNPDYDYRVLNSPSNPVCLYLADGTLIKFVGGVPVAGDGTRTNSSVSSGHLVDSGSVDFTTCVLVGDIVYNSTDNSQAKVTAIAAHDLTIDNNIFTATGKVYYVSRPSVGFIHSITDAAGKNVLAFAYDQLNSPLRNCYGTVAGSPTRSQFNIIDLCIINATVAMRKLLIKQAFQKMKHCIYFTKVNSSDSYALLKQGDLIVIRDEVRVVWAKIDPVNYTIMVSGGFNFIPNVVDIYFIGSARISSLSHTDGRCVKFYYYADGNGKNCLSTVLSSDNVRAHLNIGDLFLNKYTFDANNNLTKFEALDSSPFVSLNANKTNFDSGGADSLGIVAESTYFTSLQHLIYTYLLTKDPDPASDAIQVINNNGAITAYLFQKGGFCAHTFNQKNVFSAVVRAGSSASTIHLEKSDNLFKVNSYIGTSRAYPKDLKDGKGRDYTAVSQYVKILTVKSSTRIVVEGFTIAPLDGDGVIVIDAASVKSGGNPLAFTSKDTPLSNANRVYFNFGAGGIVLPAAGDYLAIRDEIRKIISVDAGKTYVDVDTPYSFYPSFSAGADQVCVIDGQAVGNNYFVYYLNKPKVVKVTYKKNADIDEWKANSHAYVYLKKGTEYRDDPSGGGFIWADTSGPSIGSVIADDIELIRAHVFSYLEGLNHSRDYLQDMFTFQYDDKKRIMGEKEQKHYRKSKSKWIPINMQVNVLGFPCADSVAYGVTSYYYYAATCDYSSVDGVPSDLNWKWYVDNDFDDYGRVIRSRKYAEGLPGGQPIIAWNQYVGIGTINGQLDPYARFQRNAYSPTYQGLFDSHYCFEILAGTIRSVDGGDLFDTVYYDFDSLLNVVHKRVVEATLLDPSEVSYTVVQFTADDGQGHSTSDPHEIYWELGQFDPSNPGSTNWDNAVFYDSSSSGYFGAKQRDVITAFTYESTFNRLTLITRPAGNAIVLTYGASGWQRSFIVQDSVELDVNLGGLSQYLVNKYAYDIKGRMTQKCKLMTSDSSGNTQYDSSKYPQQVLQFTFDGMDRILLKSAGATVTGPTPAAVLQNIYDDANRVVTSIDYLGFWSQVTYDEFFRQTDTQKYKPSNNADKNLTHNRTSDLRIARMQIVYDEMAGKPWQSTIYTGNDGQNNQRTILQNEFDEIGRSIKVLYKNTDSLFGGDNRFHLMKEIEYDDENNSIVTKEYAGDTFGAVGYFQNQLDNDWLGRGVAKEHNWEGVNGLGNERVVETFYDHLGNLVKRILPSGEEYYYTYNSTGKRERVDYPDGTFAIANYDINGRLVKTIDRRAIEIDVAYDKADLPVQTTTIDPVHGTISVTKKHTHYGLASIAEVDGAGAVLTTEQNYHFTGSPTMVKQTADARVLELDATYDAAGNQLTMVASSPTGASWTKAISFDAQYHPGGSDSDHFNRTLIGTSPTINPLLIRKFSYTGTLDSIYFADGAGSNLTNLAYSYDQFLRVRRVLSSDNQFDLNLARDLLGNILSRKEPNDGSVINSSYAYDGMRRLSAGENETLVYDELSNFLTRGSKVYQYQDIGPGTSQARLASLVEGASTKNYSYGDNGNVVSISGRFSNIE